MSTDLPQTLGALRDAGYQTRSVKQEMRDNLLQMLQRGEPLFPGIVGYEETVLPQIENGILSLHDLLFLGLRGQGKTRLLRMLVRLLDPVIPVVAGSEINDDPFRPLSRYARDQVSRYGNDCLISWLPREQRYHEKLATPDVTIADLIGEIDLIKHAEGKHLSNEEILHFGLIPRSHRGIFCMNELPDLSPKIQVGLFNVLEERDVQIRGFPVRLELDVAMVFSANPEDYTNRGRIVTPLKDRIGSVIRTHYPLTRALGLQIIDENAWTRRPSPVTVQVPQLIREMVEETSRLARSSGHVNQASGVSVRMSIANYENLVSNAERRGLLQKSPAVIARVSDLFAMISSSRGKLELTMTEEPGQEDQLIERIVAEAVKSVFDEHFKPSQFRQVVEHFETGATLELGDETSPSESLKELEKIPSFRKQLGNLARDLEPQLASGPQQDELLVCLGEFVLQGLHCHNKLNRTHKQKSTRFTR